MLDWKPTVDCHVRHPGTGHCHTPACGGVLKELHAALLGALNIATKAEPLWTKAEPFLKSADNFPRGKMSRKSRHLCSGQLYAHTERFSAFGCSL
jgi:hypothetical protein